MSTELARELVASVHQRFNQIPMLDVAQLPTEHSTETGQLGKILDDALKGVHPDVQTRIRSEYFGWGPIEALICDETITEIVINGPTSICYEKYGTLHLWPDSFLSEVTYKNFVVRLCRDSHTQITVEHPFANGKWQQFRVHLAAAPCIEHGVVICLRQHPKTQWSFEKLREAGWAPSSAIDLFQSLIEQRQNILVVGNTGSGKTSVLNACLGLLSPTERVVVIEDTPELVVSNLVSTKLLTRFDPQHILGDIDQSELIRQALRMRPDRICVGEVRGPEAKDLLMALATGHGGSLGSLHADSARQALLRLEMLIQLGAPQWSLQAIRNLILVSLQCVAVVKRAPSGVRYLESIHRICSLEDFGFLIEPIYQARSDKLEPRSMPDSA